MGATPKKTSVDECLMKEKQVSCNKGDGYTHMEGQQGQVVDPDNYSRGTLVFFSLHFSLLCTTLSKSENF